MPKILYFVTEDWFFASHFLPMARAAREAGFDVVVATRVGEKAQRIVNEGIRLVALGGARRSLSPMAGIRDLFGGFKIVRMENPDIVHCIALRPVVLGSIAAKLARVRGQASSWNAVEKKLWAFLNASKAGIEMKSAPGAK